MNYFENFDNGMSGFEIVDFLTDYPNITTSRKFFSI